MLGLTAVNLKINLSREVGDNLKKSGNSPTDMEQRWDQRAEIYNEFQKKDKSLIPAKVVTYLSKRGVLDDQKVLDVGGGTGRYAILFGIYAKAVALTDISTQMIKYALENAQEAKIDNIHFEKLDWNQVDLAKKKMAKAYDFVFASMCPSIRGGEGFEGLEKMVAASRNWCGINQFIYHRDSLYEELVEEFGAPSHPDPHNDREFVSTVFNYLWEQGYEVNIHTLSDTQTTFYPVETVLADYWATFSEVAKKEKKSFEKIIRTSSEDGQIGIMNELTTALILWQVKK